MTSCPMIARAPAPCYRASFWATVNGAVTRQPADWIALNLGLTAGYHAGGRFFSGATAKHGLSLRLDLHFRSV